MSAYGGPYYGLGEQGPRTAAHAHRRVSQAIARRAVLGDLPTDEQVHEYRASEAGMFAASEASDRRRGAKGDRPTC